MGDSSCLYSSSFAYYPGLLHVLFMLRRFSCILHGLEYNQSYYTVHIYALNNSFTHESYVSGGVDSNQSWHGIGRTRSLIGVNEQRV